MWEHSKQKATNHQTTTHIIFPYTLWQHPLAGNQPHTGTWVCGQLPRIRKQTKSLPIGAKNVHCQATMMLPDHPCVDTRSDPPRKF
jgi:hypothetical protein